MNRRAPVLLALLVFSACSTSEPPPPPPEPVQALAFAPQSAPLPPPPPPGLNQYFVQAGGKGQRDELADGKIASKAAGVPGGVVGGVVGGVYMNAPTLMERMAQSANAEFNTESYARFDENPFEDAARDPLSTFSIDVDTASYTNVRRFLRDGQRPPRDAVRIEELINYFSFADPPPPPGAPFSVAFETAACPWNEVHRLLRIGLKGAPITFAERRPGNYVFLLDVSGSMHEPNKLPLVKSALKMLAGQLGAQDTIAIAVYASSEGLVLPATPGSDQTAILGAIEQLEAGGSTNGGAGIQLAYSVARENFVQGGANRVILATDGDFNVGVTNEGDLTRMIEKEAKDGVFLTVLGFGLGNLKDSTLEKLADRGNGNYAYIDSELEARRTLVEQAGGSMITIAKDVKIQVEFNPAEVSAYRLIGYENRRLAAADFNDDAKDAGEIGAGLSVTALYEIAPARDGSARPVDPLRYQAAASTDAASSGELCTVKLRYKAPDGDVSQLLTFAVRDAGLGWRAASPEMQFAAAVGAFGMLLRDSEHRGAASFDLVRSLAEAGVARDADGRRAEFIELIERAQAVTKPTDVS